MKIRIQTFLRRRIFIGDVGKGDLWYFPAGFPHSIQGLGPDGSEFILIFNQGTFSEDNTFPAFRLGEAYAAIGVVQEFWIAGERS